MTLNRIGVKLVLMATAILAAEVGTRSYFEMVKGEENSRRDFIRAGQAHAMSLAQGAEYGLLTRDKDELEKVAARYRTEADADLLYVAFYDEAGQLLASRDWHGLPHLIAHAAKPVAQVTSERIDSPDKSPGEYYRFMVPVAVSREMAVPGTDAAATAGAPSAAGERALVVCARSYEEVRQRVAADQRDTMAVSAAIFGAAILAFLVFSRRLVRPIYRLVAGTERVAAGDLDVRVDVGGRRDEFRALADSFNRMIEQLQQQRLQIVSYSQELEKKVTDRTQELAEANTRLQAANSQLEALATTDELTGLWNRRRFVEMLDRDCRRAARARVGLALAMLDVDRFKGVNDTFGHAFGDRVLVALAEALRREARGADIVARYGGEEFMVLMPDTTAEEAVSAAERIRKRVAAQAVSDGKRTVQITVSIGISALGAGGAAAPESLVRLADEALYAAKQSGRNCTRTWSQVSREQKQEALGEAAEVKELQHHIAGLSLQAKDAFVESIQGLVQAVEAHDPYTSSHSDDVTSSAVGIAEQMGLDPEEVAVIRRASKIHDIGKIGVPDAILRKPGPLTDDERRLIEQHVLIGVHILDPMRFLEREVPIVRHHHERWDGTGYPDGIAGRAISIGGRILAVADAFAALTSDRPYRQAGDLPDVLRTLAEESGTKFDPAVVDALLAWLRASGRHAHAPDEAASNDVPAGRDPTDQAGA